MKKTIVIVGAGPGLGNHIAEEFGKHDFRVVLMARREEKLKAYVKELEEKGIEAYWQVVNCADNTSIVAAFDAVKKQFGTIDVMEYNAAVKEGGLATVISPEELMRRHQVDVAGALCAVQQVVPGMKEQKSGAILFTGGGLGLAPASFATSMSLDKAALRALAILLHDELKEDGIFAGIVNVKGGVDMDEYYASDKIAQLFFKLYEEQDSVEITY